MTRTAAKKLANAARQRAHRAREKSGRAVMPIEFDLASVVAGLTEGHFITSLDGENRQKIKAGLEQVIELVFKAELSTFLVTRHDDKI